MKESSMPLKIEWLGGRDSNPDKQSQSLTPSADSDFFHPASQFHHNKLTRAGPFRPLSDVCCPRSCHKTSHTINHITLWWDV